MPIDISNNQLNSVGANVLAYSSVVTSGLVMYLDAGIANSYPGSGTTWTDLSGYGNNDTLVNGPTYTTSNGGSIVFDGVDDYSTVPMTNLRPTSGITQECWFKSNTTSGAQVFIGAQYGTSSNNSYALWWESGNWMGGINIGGAFHYFNTVYAQSSGVWYHFVHTYNGSTQKLYVNAVEIASESRSGAITYDTNNTLLAIGGDWNGPGYNSGMVVTVNGNMSIVRMYNRGLTASEVLQNFNANRRRFNI